MLTNCGHFFEISKLEGIEHFLMELATAYINNQNYSNKTSIIGFSYFYASEFISTLANGGKCYL